MATDRSIKDKRYEQKHKEERKAKYMIWGTSVPRKYAEEINEFLAKYGFTKPRNRILLLLRLWTAKTISSYRRKSNSSSLWMVAGMILDYIDFN